MVRTTTDLAAVARAMDDEPTRLRHWGGEQTYPFPPARAGEWSIGSGAECWLRLVDPQRSVSRRHAVMRREQERWHIVDAESKNGLWIDGERTASAALVSGAELTFGRLRFVIESPRTIRQRGLLGRFLGWRAEQAPGTDRALRALRAYAAMRVPLSLAGEDDLVSIARRIHREVVGEAPFVVTRTDDGAEENAEALGAATGGTLCFVGRRLLDDLRSVRTLSSDRAPQCRLVICTRLGEQLASIEVPTLASRPGDLERIVDEYAADAIAELGAGDRSFTFADRAMLLESELPSLGEIELATRRMIAIREYGGVGPAADVLGVSHSALARWLARRVRGVSERRG